MKIKKHIPNACDGIDSVEVEFKTKSELLNIPFVLDFRMYPFCEDKENPYFKRYSISPSNFLFIQNPNSENYLLMAEFNINDKWKEAFGVVGYITKNKYEELDFPIWEDKG